jgi:hypothetical protein
MWTVDQLAAEAEEKYDGRLLAGEGREHRGRVG